MRRKASGWIVEIGARGRRVGVDFYYVRGDVTCTLIFLRATAAPVPFERARNTSENWPLPIFLSMTNVCRKTLRQSLDPTTSEKNELASTQRTKLVAILWPRQVTLSTSRMKAVQLLYSSKSFQIALNLLLECACIKNSSFSFLSSAFGAFHVNQLVSLG